MNLNLSHWTKKDYKNYLNYLISLKDLDYLSFNKKLVTTSKKIIGIRIPTLRKLAKDICLGNALEFLSFKIEGYYEEIMIKGFVIAYLKEEGLPYIDDFISYVDNWAICDSFCNSLVIVKKKQDYFFNKIKDYLQSKDIFTVRIGLVLLLNFYVEKNYIKDIFKLLEQINSEEYYVQMAMAWLICECFIKEQELTYPFLKKNNLSPFVQNKAISKIRDSYRVSNNIKNDLLSFRKI